MYRKVFYRLGLCGIFVAVVCVSFFCAEARELGVAVEQPVSERRISRLDEFILKAYEVTESILRGEDDYDNQSNLPLKGIFINTSSDVQPVLELPKDGGPAPQTEDEPLKESKAPKPLGPIVSTEDDDDGKRGGLVGWVIETSEDEEKETKTKGEVIYWEKVRQEYNRKRQAEKLKKKHEAEAKKEKAADIKAIRHDGIPLPTKRPRTSYRTQILPSLIHKKSYNKANDHLPKVVYSEEYIKILFDSVAASDLDVMRAMIERLGTTEVTDKEGNTPLLYAVILANKTSIKVLTGMGASINVRNNLGTTPLHAALKLSRIDILKMLLKRSADPDIVDKHNRTPLIMAVENKSHSAVELLLKHGAVLSRRMVDGNTVLHASAKNNSQQITLMLIEGGADIDIRNFEGSTPLMVAAANDSVHSAEILLQAGADTLVKNAMGRDAAMIASIKGHATLSRLIKRIEKERLVAYAKMKSNKKKDK